MLRAMSRRWSLALGLSVLVHLALIGMILGVGARRFTGPVDIEITGLDQVKDLPLGGPAGGHGAGHGAHRAHHKASPPPEGTLASRADEHEQAGRPALVEDPDAPAPTSDLGAYGPKGSRLTVLLRLDRLRGTDFVAPVDALLQRLPDRHDLLEGTDLDLFASFDALLIATPHPLDPTVTFLAVRHHLDDAQLRQALTRGAKATDRVIAWRTEGGRPVGERRPRRGLPPVAGPPSRDDRLIVLAAPGLAVVTPPAYRALLFAPPKPAAAADGGTTPEDGGAAPEGGSGDGGAALGGGAAAIDWTTMLWRIDAEEGLMPPDGALMVSAVDIFKTNHAGGLPPVIYGMEVPAAVSAVIGFDDDQVFLDLDGEFAGEEPARHWETEWPTIAHKVSVNPLVLLGGFTSLISHATLTRDGRTIHVHLSAAHDEAQRLLALALHMLGG
jgi:hypothetical protein